MLLNEGSGMYLDIPESNAEENNIVELYQIGHGGENQLWKWQDNHIVCVLDEDLCLGVTKIKGNDQVCLKSRGQPGTHWKKQNNRILTSNTKDPLALTASYSGELSLQPQSEGEYQVWTDCHSAVNESKPACSCHLRYGDITKEECARDWRLQCTVTVEHSADETYFCVAGWGPGGYSGIQQVNSEKKVAIFSMWNGKDKGAKVTAVAVGEGVTLDDFGGEGTGLKTMTPLHWREGEPITFIIEGVRGEKVGKKISWQISCWFESRGVKRFMATYERVSDQLPLNTTGFYSFVEDWNRAPGAEGYKYNRSALFSGPKIGERFLNHVDFTKVETGADKFASGLAHGGCVCEGCHLDYLSTGGEEEKGEKKCACKCTLEHP